MPQLSSALGHSCADAPWESTAWLQTAAQGLVESRELVVEAPLVDAFAGALQAAGALSEVWPPETCMYPPRLHQHEVRASWELRFRV